ncbi:MAG: alpha/beta hydrolase [Porticoccaceae bacterium]|nr:alpha/beta hydrolase [Porticoccaceae bacterium]
MPIFDSQGVEITYERWGTGEPVILAHGFAANRRQAWLAADWQGTLMQAGREAILFDQRGHGDSQKCYEPVDYAIETMAGDLLRLMDHLDIATAPVISHSMGARITLHLILHHSDRISAAVLIGVGESLLLERHDPEIMAQALLSDEPWAIEDQAAASFRAFVDSTRSDHKALAACTHGIDRELEQELLTSITVPTLILGAEQDEFSGPIEPLAEVIAGAKCATLPRTSHHSILADPAAKDIAFEFLGLPPPVHYEHSW